MSAIWIALIVIGAVIGIGGAMRENKTVAAVGGMICFAGSVLTLADARVGP
jgi:hypothetical protein